jgi:hypothetical protein
MERDDMSRENFYLYFVCRELFGRIEDAFALLLPSPLLLRAVYAAMLAILGPFCGPFGRARAKTGN